MGVESQLYSCKACFNEILMLHSSSGLKCVNYTFEEDKRCIECWCVNLVLISTWIIAVQSGWGFRYAGGCTAFHLSVYMVSRIIWIWELRMWPKKSWDLQAPIKQDCIESSCRHKKIGFFLNTYWHLHIASRNSFYSVLINKSYTILHGVGRPW